MKSRGSWNGAAALAAALFVVLATPARAQAPDSLALQAPTDLTAWSDYDSQLKRFTVWLTWRESPDELSAFVNPPDTSGWALVTPSASISAPSARGPYTGDIDRTIVFRATRGGTVGQDSVQISYEVRREEYVSGRITLGPTYVPNTWVPLVLRDQRNGQTVDYGIQMRFGRGKVDQQGGFILGLEDFEGFHIWRGTRADGSDLEIIGELSKEEAFIGNRPGGSQVDSVYFYDILPTLRDQRPWISPFGEVDCLGTRIDRPLDADQLFWFDCNATNGFTYFYAVTTFDRGYSPNSSQQGLVKYDHCPVAEGQPYPCAEDEMKSLKMEVDPQDDLYRVYVVPNPVRTGSSRLTTDNYHNFPDGLVRFVNVPARCTIKIYTVAGDLVWINEHDGAGNAEWDTRNLEEQDVASGVYVYRIEANGDSVYGRIVVIR